MTLEQLALHQAELTLVTTIIGLFSTLFSKKVRDILKIPFIFLYKSFSNKALETKLDIIVAELQYNGGSSLKDAVRRLELAIETKKDDISKIYESIDNIKDELHELRNSVESKQGNLVAKFTAMLDQPSTPPMFEANSEGECTWVSSTYIAMLGKPIHELLGWGWVSSIHSDDADEVRDKWELCVEEKRVFEHTYRFIDAHEKVIKVKCRATPIMNNGVVTGWIGMLNLQPHKKPLSNVELLVKV